MVSDNGLVDIAQIAGENHFFGHARLDGAQQAACVGEPILHAGADGKSLANSFVSAFRITSTGASLSVHI